MADADAVAAAVTPAQVRAAIQERAASLEARSLRESHVVAAVNALLMRARTYPAKIEVSHIVTEMPGFVNGRAAYLGLSSEQIADIVRTRFGSVHTVRSAWHRDPWERTATLRIVFSNIADADADADADAANAAGAVATAGGTAKKRARATPGK